MYLGCDKEELQSLFEDFLKDFYYFKDFIKHANRAAFENWKAGGFLVDKDIISMYNTMETAFESALNNLEEEEEE
jgi:hypothetical protein